MVAARSVGFELSSRIVLFRDFFLPFYIPDVLLLLSGKILYELAVLSPLKRPTVFLLEPVGNIFQPQGVDSKVGVPDTAGTPNVKLFRFGVVPALEIINVSRLVALELNVEILLVVLLVVFEFHNLEPAPINIVLADLVCVDDPLDVLDRSSVGFPSREPPGREVGLWGGRIPAVG